jgi:hypothetical protein
MGSPSKDGNLVTLGNEIGLLRAIYKVGKYQVKEKYVKEKVKKNYI